MKIAIVLAAAFFAAVSVQAADSGCDTQAVEKKLAGAAKASFLKKCKADASKDAAAACNTQAADKKLAGAAKASFVKKCVADAGAK